MGRTLPALFAMAGVAVMSPAKAADDLGRWYAGAYSFSDELGGFRILGVSGTGARDDPFVVVEEFHSSSPVTLVIRTALPIRPFDPRGLFASGHLHMRVEAVNGSGQAWVEFEFELQEVRDRPSMFGDGLSFDQRKENTETIGSDSFARFSRDFEPYDRLLYRDGHVDPGASAGFSFFITDFTPRSQFYLVQDPRIPSS
ncbi:hypothetical protein RHIZO_02394 [Rhizobiaceae bacterium]|nr:hypothetical protein RHIZO_02394 [Rhizobiaceae bacterium]